MTKRPTSTGLAFASLALSASLAASPAAATPAAHLTADSSRVVAVMPLNVDARDTLLAPLGYALADLLSTDLARSRSLTLVERARLAAVLRELALTASGAVDSATAPRTGRFLKARRVVVGSLVRRGDRIVFDARVNDVETGRVASGFEAQAPFDDVLEAEKQLAFRLFDHLGVQLTPQERALVEARPTRNLAALLAYGQAVQAEVNGQYAAAARAFRRAAAADPSFTVALNRAEAARTSGGGGAAGLAVQRVNRPLETVPTTLRPGLATDLAFPGGTATITVDITRP
jgi:TolB-like protein